MINYPRLIVAGVRGGSGKTILSLGLIAALRSQKGLRVTPFKKGPDFIDAGWLSVAAKSSCYNLDTFLVTKEKVLNSFISHFTGDIAVIEGNRGLYDGMDAEGSYSTAELAKLLKSPVMLIVDCTKMTKTAAAVVLGCINLDKDVMIKGVVLNQISGNRHESVIRAAIEKYCSLPVLGAIPKLKSNELPERHMGLVPYQERSNLEKVISFTEDIAKKYLDIDEIFNMALKVENIEAKKIKSSISLFPVLPISHSVVRIGVIKDSAFQFYYPENLEELQRHGAEIIEINAIKDKQLPDIDALYIGGGFPETNAIGIAKNISFKDSVRKAADEGLPIYAECGGLMFLSSAIVVENKKYQMAGVFPIVFEMKKKPQAHGYTIVEVTGQNPFYPIGVTLKGHEFHYSAVISMPENNDLHTAFKMKRGQGINNKMDGVCYKNVLASYTHIHAYGTIEWAKGLINKAREHKR